MPRKPRENKPWLKLWSREWLEGSIRFECDSKERGIFTDLLALANESTHRGIIQVNEVTSFPHSWLAAKLNIPLEEFEKTLQKFIVQERIRETEFGIEIINFKFYQRQFTKRGRPSKSPPTKAIDPDKFIKGKYGHMVQR